MLIIARKPQEVDFSQLLDVYHESIQTTVHTMGSKYSENEAIVIAQLDFCSYLREVFFRISGAYMAIWAIDGCYTSVLRIEPYKDGVLLTSLETAPGKRNCGYAKKLIEAVQAQEGISVPIYAHIDRRNIASRRVHEACGFLPFLDYAVLIDGSVSRRYKTWKWV